MKTKRLTITIIAIIVLAFAGYAGYKFYTQYGKQRVDVLVMPVKASVEIEGVATLKGSDTIYLEPGDYKITASRDGFTADSRDFTVRDSEQTVTLMLQPFSEDAIDESNSEINQETSLKIEGIVGQQMALEGEVITEQNPITAVLPYENLLYQIGYKADPNDDKSVIVVISSFQGYRNLAINKIRDFGFEPTDLKIEFGNGYENPFIRYEGED